MKKLALMLSLTIATLQAINVVNAQGFGVYGANRRVVSPKGYGGISQEFTEPSIGKISQQYESIAPIADPCGGSGTVNIRAKYKDVPQMYTGVNLPKGSKPPFEVDAGVTWRAHKSLTFPSKSRIDTTNNPGSKWTTFLRVFGVNNGCYIPLKNNPQWSKSSMGRVEVRVVLFNEGIGFAVKQMPASSSLIRVIQPYPPGVNKELLRTSAQSKRVIAMTQQTRPDYDGCFMRGAVASDGWLWSLAPLPGNTGIELGGLHRWNTVGGDAQFFDPKGRYGEIPLNKRQDVPLVIQTGKPYDRKITDGVQKKPDAGYFREETVSIEMFPAVKAKGKPVTNR